MGIFLVYAFFFILFEDYDRSSLSPFSEPSDWHLLVFSLIIMIALSGILLRYAKRMDHRISREQAIKESAMRRQLTNNIAHELKTPVASILGYAETLLDHPEMDNETQRQFIARTYSQATRLTSLLQDISMLNRTRPTDQGAHRSQPLSERHCLGDILEIATTPHHLTQLPPRRHCYIWQHIASI